MKIERLIGIIMYLNRQGRVTAETLAQRYEVSPRTIRRDIDSISQAGIPIVAYQGQDGGYEIMPSYKIDQSVLTVDEGGLILTLLEGMRKVYPFSDLSVLEDKLSVLHTEQRYFGHIEIDFSSWGNNSTIFIEKITCIEDAFREKCYILFSYYNLKGEFSARKVEPIRLIMKNMQWYLLAFCCNKQDYRFFKIRRMRNISLGETIIEAHSLDKHLPLEQNWNISTQVIKIKIKSDFICRLDDYFDAYEREENIVTFQWPKDEWLYSFLLGFGDQIEVIEPTEIRQMIKERTKRMSDLYCE